MMLSRLKIFLTLVILVAAGLQAAPADPEILVQVSIDRDTIGLDEQAVMSVIIKGPSQNLPSPQLTTMPTFEIYSQGSSTNISIVNGVVSASNNYRYLLLPKKAGTYVIDQISVVYQNRRYKGNAVDLVVLNQGSAAPAELEEKAQDSRGNARDYFLEASVDNKNPYVGEQVTLTLKFYIGITYYGSPELTEPTTTGFWTEVLGNSAPYRQRLNGVPYKVIERKYALFPTQVGDLTIGSATIKATVADRNKRYRDPFDVLGDMFGRGVEITARSRSLRVNVKPLPEADKPDNYSGTVGRFKMETFVDKRKVEVNQPVTVKVQISGTGNVKSVPEPDIPDSPDFRVYRASSNENLSKTDDRIGGSKVFEEVFIPRRPGVLEIPSMSFSYFDPDKGTYRNLSSDALKIDVTKPEGYVAGPGTQYTAPELTISSQGSEIKYIKKDIGDLHKSGDILLLRPLYLVINAVPVLFLAGLVVARKRREKLAGNVGLARARAAAKTAKKKLARAKAIADEAHAEPFFAEISSAFTSYIANKLNVSAHGLTIDGIRKLLAEREADEQLISHVKDLLMKCDFARFASSSSVDRDEIRNTLKSAEELIIRLEGISFD